MLTVAGTRNQPAFAIAWLNKGRHEISQSPLFFGKYYRLGLLVSSSTKLPVLIRTLLAAGYEVREALRQPSHIEVIASRVDEFDVPVPYLISISDGTCYSEGQLAELRTAAHISGSQLVLVASESGAFTLSFEEFLERLGGPIPSWRALTADFASRLTQLSRNELPPGESGEAWRLFEEAVSDGLEFLFGRRVRRLGAGRRGTRVADCICSTRDDAIILVDAKAARDGFDAANENLRALKEYAQLQKRVQHGQQPLSSCLIVSSGFDQDVARLQEIGMDFFTEAGVPVAFLTSADLGRMIDVISSRAVRQRGAVRWKAIFGVPGQVLPSKLIVELDRITQLQMGRV